MAPNFTGRSVQLCAIRQKAAYCSAPAASFSPTMAGRQAGPPRGPGAILVARDPAQPLDRVVEPRLAADGEVEARVAVGDDVEPGPRLLGDEAAHRVEVLLAERVLAERLLEGPAAQA